MSPPRRDHDDGGPNLKIFLCVVMILLFTSDDACSQNQHVEQVSGFYGPGAWGAWILMAVSVVVTQEYGDLPLQTAGVLVQWHREGHEDVLPIARSESREKMPVSADVLAVVGYPIIACLDYIHQVSHGVHSAQLRAAFSVVCISHILGTVVNMRYHHRTSSLRRLVWVVLQYLCFTAHLQSTFVSSGSFAYVNGWYVGALVFRIFAGLFMSFYAIMSVDYIPKNSSSLGCCGCLFIFVTVFTPFFVPLWVTSRPSYQENEKKLCQEFRVVPAIPVTGASLTDLDQAAALAVGALSAAWSFYLWSKNSHRSLGGRGTYHPL